VWTRKIFLFLNLRAYARTVPLIRPYQLPSASFEIHNSVIILTSDAVQSAILAALLNKPFMKTNEILAQL